MGHGRGQMKKCGSPASSKTSSSLSLKSAASSAKAQAPKPKITTYKWAVVSLAEEKAVGLKKLNGFFNWLMGLVGPAGAEAGAKFSRAVVPVAGVAGEVGLRVAVRALLKEQPHLLFVVAPKDQDKTLVHTWLSNLVGTQHVATVIVQEADLLSKFSGQSEASVGKSVGTAIVRQLEAKAAAKAEAEAKARAEVEEAGPAQPRPAAKLSWAVVSVVPEAELNAEDVRKFFWHTFHMPTFYGSWEPEPVAVHLGVTKQQDYRAICLQLVKKHPGLDFIWTTMEGLLWGNAASYNWKKAVEEELQPTLAQGILAVNVRTHFKHVSLNSSSKRDTVEHCIKRLSGTVQTKLMFRETGITEADRAAKLRDAALVFALGTDTGH